MPAYPDFPAPLPPWGERGLAGASGSFSRLHPAAGCGVPASGSRGSGRAPPGFPCPCPGRTDRSGQDPAPADPVRPAPRRSWPLRRRRPVSRAQAIRGTGSIRRGPAVGCSPQGSRNARCPECGRETPPEDRKAPGGTRAAVLVVACRCSRIAFQDLVGPGLPNGSLRPPEGFKSCANEKISTGSRKLEYISICILYAYVKHLKYCLTMKPGSGTPRGGPK